MHISKKIVLYFSIPIMYLLLLLLPPEMVNRLATEDGIIEYLGAFAFFLTSVFFAYLFFQSTKSQNIFLGKATKRNVYFGLLGLLFLFGAGEEISWGQRIFDWETSEYMKRVSAQQETNLHNLFIFDSMNRDGTKKNFLQLFVTVNRMYILFWLMFCLLIPLLYKISEKAKNIITFLGIPIVPLWIGGLFLINLLLQQQCKYLVPLFDNSSSMLRSISESKESISAFIFLLVAIYFFKKNKTNNTNFQIQPTFVEN